MTNISIAPFSSSQANLLQHLWVATFSAAYHDVHSAENIAAYCDTNFTLEAAQSALSDPLTLCKFAGPVTAPQGYYVLRQQSCPITDHVPAYELKQIYLMAEAYGTGIGKALFEDAVAEARAGGAKCLWLSVSDKNIRAQRFYQKLGFSVAGRGPDFHVGTDRLTSQILILDFD